MRVLGTENRWKLHSRCACDARLRHKTEGQGVSGVKFSAREVRISAVRPETQDVRPCGVMSLRDSVVT